MIIDIQHLANTLGLPGTSATAFINDSIKVRSLSHHQGWVEKNENLLTTLIGVLDDSGAIQVPMRFFLKKRSSRRLSRRIPI